MLIFEKVSPENTPTAIKLALEKAKENGSNYELGYKRQVN